MPQLSNIIAFASVILLASPVFCRPVDDADTITFKEIPIPEDPPASMGTLPFEMFDVDSYTNFGITNPEESTYLGSLIGVSSYTLPNAANLQTAAGVFRTCSGGTTRFAYCCAALECYYKSACAEGEVPSCCTVNGTPGVDQYWNCIDAQFETASSDTTSGGSSSGELQPSTKTNLGEDNLLDPYGVFNGQ